MGTHNALGLALRQRARFMLASTSEVYGDPLVHPQPEAYWGNVNPIGIRGVYDEAKRYAEAMTMAYRRHHRVDTRIVRSSTLTAQDEQTTAGWCQTSSPRRSRGSLSPSTAKEPRRRSIQYVDDLIEGVFRLMRSSEGRPVNIGNPDEHARTRDRPDDSRDLRQRERDRLRSLPRG